VRFHFPIFEFPPQAFFSIGMTDFVLFERDGAIVTLTLNRPEERNALSTQAQWDELVDCCARIRTDESVKVVILTGAGTAFSAGGNVKDMRDKKGIAAGTPYAVSRGYQGAR
jgi:enoyl-CoA hydratase/carnithine racemase